MIHEGRSDVAIPSVRDDADVRDLYKDWLFSYTDNHWANLEETKNLTAFCYERFIRKWMAKKGVNEVSKQACGTCASLLSYVPCCVFICRSGDGPT